MVRKLITTFSEQPNLTSSCLLASSMEDRGFGHIRDYFQNVVKFWEICSCPAQNWFQQKTRTQS